MILHPNMQLYPYIDDVILRQQIEKQLNKIELSNKFAKAVFFANSQEFRVGSTEEQMLIVACRVFIQNCIVLWNYLYLSDVLAKQQDSRDKESLLQIIRNSSVITWQHINLQGEYDFTSANDSVGMVFDLDKIKKLRVA